MKNLLLALIVITGFTACKNDAATSGERNIQLLADSTAYMNNNIYSDTLAVKENEIQELVSETPKEPIKTRRVRSYEPRQERAAVYTRNDNTTEAVPPVATPPIVTSPNTNSENSESVGAGGTEGTETGTTEDKPEKKGWNKATQGAVIGGVAGAVGGAIISKKKGLGAVIGGVVGAAGGYIIGKKMDKKDKMDFDF